jgi:hypothetical protein
MGTDVIGMNPTSDVGREFRHTCEAWHPLAEYVCEIAPEITSRCTYWHSNDYDGLSEDDARGLAEILQREIDSGRTEAYVRLRQSELKLMPNERCEICNGTGDPDKNDILCSECNWEEHTEYALRTQNVQRFATFLRVCGGFQIW